MPFKFRSHLFGTFRALFRPNLWQAYLVLLVVPIATIAVGLLVREYTTPYYIFHHDPDYAYLFNGISILNFVAPAHIDHPGTPLQVFMAVLLKLMHPLENVSAIIWDVLQDPEKHLVAASNVILIIVAAAVFAAGAYVHMATGEVAPALMVQLPPLVFAVLIHSLPRVTPEPLLLIISMVFAMLLAALVWNRRSPKPTGHVRALGLVSGLGMATKLTFLPVLAVPVFVYRAWVDRKRFLKFVLIGFVVATLPMLLRFPLLVEYRGLGRWIFNLFVGAGIYGQGPKTIIDVHTYTTNLWRIVLDQPLYLLIVGTATAVLLIGLWKSRRDRGGADSTALRVLAGLVAMHLTMIAMLAKHYQDARYLAATLGLAGFTIALAYTLAARWWSASRWFKPVCLSIMAGAALVLAVPAWKALPALERGGAERKAWLAAVDETVRSGFSQCARIDQDSATKEFALFFGLQWSRKSTTTKLIRDRYFEDKMLFTYDPGARLFLTMQQQAIPLEQIKQQAPCVILRGPDSLKVL